MPSMASNPSSDLQPEPETLAEEEEMSPPDVESSGSNPSSNPQRERERRSNAIEADADDSMYIDDDDDIYGSDDLLASDDDDDDDGTDYGEHDDDDEDDDDEDSDDDSEREEEEEEGEDEEEEEGNGIESCNRSGGADCPICLVSWNSDGPHRICCIPCGHVYGRSCLEQWLQRRQRKSAKCPQCREKFKHKNIINLHAQLTTATNESNNASASGEKIEVQGKQEEWLTSKRNWDIMLCSILDSLLRRHESLHLKFNGLEVILKILLLLQSEMKNMSGIIEERLGKKIDENFHKLLELYRNPSDVSESTFDTTSLYMKAASLVIEGLVKQIVDAVDELVGKKIDEHFNKRFEDFRNQVGVSSVPSASMPKDT